MTDRFLVWLDVELIHYFITKFLQEKYDAEYSTVIDIPRNLQKYFEKQNIINFKKTWFYRDKISLKMKKPDLNYLSLFESKYGINLWQLAYNERNFYRFTKHHKFNDNEILWILEQECKFFEEVLNESKPTHFLLKLYDSHHLHLLYELCKQKGIKTMMLAPTRLANRAAIYSNFDELEKAQTQSNFVKSDINNKEQPEIILENYMDKNLPERQKTIITRWSYKTSKKSQAEAAIKFLLKTNFEEYGNYFPNYGKTLWRLVKKRIITSWKKNKNESFLNKHAIKEIPNESFVFFPLHVEPERTISIDAPYHTNQVEEIHQVAKSLPVNFKLFVKEHPVQFTAQPRDISFYKKILEMPNVRLIHPLVSSIKLIKQCSLIVTINGTVGLEGQFYGKPSIVLANPIYSCLPTVYKLKSYDELPQLIKSSLENKVDIQTVENFRKLLEQESFEFSWDDLSLNVAKTFFYGGFTGEVEISNNQIQSFMNKNKDIFEKLADEHLKKINLYKKLKNN